ANLPAGSGGMGWRTLRRAPGSGLRRLSPTAPGDQELNLNRSTFDRHIENTRKESAMSLGFSRRKFIYVGAGVAAIGGLSACGSTEADPTADSTAEPTAEETGGSGNGEGAASGAMVTVPKLTGIAWFNRMETGVE